MGRLHGRAWTPAALAAVVLALAVAPASGGPDISLTGPGGRTLHGSWARWARASLMPTVSGRVTVRMGGCPALPRAAGCVYRSRPRTIYLRSGLQRPRSVLLHEMGHLFDLRVMNNSDRGRFRKILRAHKRRWWAGKIPLAEQFAEAYSFCARYNRIVSIARYSNYQYRPTRRQHAKICTLIVKVAGDGKRPAPPPQAPPVTRSDPVPPPQPPPSTVPGSGGKPQPKPTPTPTPRPAPTPRPVPTPLPVPTIFPFP
jgi:hypothetical protein